ncbi:MAG: hypothetical protein HY243_18525 [Proteobacteria bacterium]|nr:hypothetical protein [Pseudomonadota bacterium]
MRTENKSTKMAGKSQLLTWQRPQLKKLATEDAELRRHGSPDLTVNS